MGKTNNFIFYSMKKNSNHTICVIHVETTDNKADLKKKNNEEEKKKLLLMTPIENLI